MFCALFLLFSHKLRLFMYLYVCRIKNICDKNTPRKVFSEKCFDTDTDMIQYTVLFGIHSH
jgi:hypothetical protein